MNAQKYTEKSLEAIQRAQSLTIEHANQSMEPVHLLSALLTQEQAGRQEAGALIDRLYQGRADRLVAALLGGDRLSADEIAGLRRLIEELPDDAAVE